MRPGQLHAVCSSRHSCRAHGTLFFCALITRLPAAITAQPLHVITRSGYFYFLIHRRAWYIIMHSLYFYLNSRTAGLAMRHSHYFCSQFNRGKGPPVRLRLATNPHDWRISKISISGRCLGRGAFRRRRFPIGYPTYGSPFSAGVKSQKLELAGVVPLFLNSAGQGYIGRGVSTLSPPFCPAPSPALNPLFYSALFLYSFLPLPLPLTTRRDFRLDSTSGNCR